MSTEAFIRQQYADIPILIEIARCESTFRQFDESGEVLRGKVNPKDVGAMQINERYHLEASQKLGIDIYALHGNLEYGRLLYKKYGVSPWLASEPCWRHGDYPQVSSDLTLAR